MTAQFLLLDCAALLTIMSTAVFCAILGCLLFHQRRLLLADSLSHIAFPGIVCGALVFASTAPVPLLLGAFFFCFLGTQAIGAIQRLTPLEPGAALGIVFTSFFALGLVLLERAGWEDVHIDTQHVLFGNLEGNIWVGPEKWSDLLRPSILMTLPAETLSAFLVLLAVGLWIVFLFKELRLFCFDPQMGASLGLPLKGLRLGMTALTVAAVVSAFHAVGSVLTIALFALPATTASLLTRRLSGQIKLAALIAAAAAGVGYGFAGFGPSWLGFDAALGTAGTIALTLTLLLFLCWCATNPRPKARNIHAHDLSLAQARLSEKDHGKIPS